MSATSRSPKSDARSASWGAAVSETASRSRGARAPGNDAGASEFEIGGKDLQRAFAQIGKVLEVSELASTVKGRCRYGLQSVKLRAAVLDGPEGKSIVQIQGFGDDIWGGGARKGTDKLIAALEALQAIEPSL